MQTAFAYKKYEFQKQEQIKDIVSLGKFQNEQGRSCLNIYSSSNHIQARHLHYHSRQCWMAYPPLTQHTHFLQLPLHGILPWEHIRCYATMQPVNQRDLSYQLFPWQATSCLASLHPSFRLQNHGGPVTLPHPRAQIPQHRTFLICTRPLVTLSRQARYHLH